MWRNAELERQICAYSDSYHNFDISYTYTTREDPEYGTTEPRIEFTVRDDRDKGHAFLVMLRVMADRDFPNFFSVMYHTLPESGVAKDRRTVLITRLGIEFKELRRSLETDPREAFEWVFLPRAVKDAYSTLSDETFAERLTSGDDTMRIYGYLYEVALGVLNAAGPENRKLLAADFNRMAAKIRHINTTQLLRYKSAHAGLLQPWTPLQREQ